MTKILLKLRIAWLKRCIKSNITMMKCYSNDITKLHQEIDLLINERQQYEHELKEAEDDLELLFM